MPIYNFENTKTGEEFSLQMSMSEREQYLKDNPDVIQTLTRMNIGDPVGLGVTKPPSDFQKYVLNKVKTVPGAQSSQIEKRWQISKEV
jgi:hypothetical protein